MSDESLNEILYTRPKEAHFCTRVHVHVVDKTAAKGEHLTAIPGVLAHLFCRSKCRLFVPWGARWEIRGNSIQLHAVRPSCLLASQRHQFEVLDYQTMAGCLS